VSCETLPKFGVCNSPGSLLAQISTLEGRTMETKLPCCCRISGLTLLRHVREMNSACCCNVARTRDFLASWNWIEWIENYKTPGHKAPTYRQLNNYPAQKASSSLPHHYLMVVAK